MDAISDASISTGHATPAVPSVDFWTEAKRALDVRTNAEVAAACGIPLRTLDRLIANPENSLVRNALRFSTATGISIYALAQAAGTTALSEAA